MTMGHAGRFSQGWLLCRISHVKTGFWHLVVICDQTGALVIGTAHEHFIQVRDFECTYRSRSLVFRRLLMNSTDFLPRLRHHTTHTPETRSAGGTNGHRHIPTSAHGLLRARFARASQTIRFGYRHFKH